MLKIKLLWPICLHSLNIGWKSKIRRLMEHKMGSHYCEWEKQAIMYLHKRKGLEVNHISEKYFIPYSTCRRLWEEVARSDFDFECSFVNSTWSHYYHDVIIEYVNSFWKKTRSPFIVKDIKNKIEHDLKIRVDY